MHQILKNGINFHVIEPERNNQNPAEGVIREIRRKWFRVMFRKKFPKKFWDYGMRWVCEIQQRTQAVVLNDIPSPRTFVSKERHTNITAAELSKRWIIGLIQATDTLSFTSPRYLILFPVTGNCTSVYSVREPFSWKSRQLINSVSFVAPTEW